MKIVVNRFPWTAQLRNLRVIGCLWKRRCATQTIGNEHPVL